jgi:ribosomal protein L29
MQHPFINDLSDKSTDEIAKTISDLQGKLTFALRMQNGTMTQQLRMVIESYNVEYTKRLDAMYAKRNVQDQINISGENKK